MQSVVRELVAGHGGEQLQQLFRRLQRELAGGGAHKEVEEDRLTDIRGIQPAPQAGVGQPDADSHANGRLVASQEFLGRLFVSVPHTADKVAK